MKAISGNSERDVIKYFLGRVLISLTSLILISLVTYNVSPLLYGKYTLMMGLVNAILSLCIGWIGSSAARYYHEYRHVSERFFANIITLYFVMLALSIALLMLFAFGFKIIDIQGYSIYLIVVTFLMAFVLIFENILRAGQFSSLHFVFFTFQSLLYLISYYLLSRHDKSLTPLFISMIISNIGVALLLVSKFQLFKLSFKQMNIPGLKLKLWRYGWPMLGLWGLGWILNLSDRFIISLFYSELEVGLYDITYKMVLGLLTMIITPFTMAVFPILIVLWNNHNIQKVKEELSGAISSFLFYIIPAGVGLVVIKNTIYGSLISRTYEDGKSIMIYIVIGISMNGLTQLLLKLWKLEEATLRILKYTIVSVILNIALNFALVPRYGNDGAAIATMISFSITTVIVFYRVQRTYHISIHLIKIIKIMIGSSIMAIFVYLQLLLVDQGIIAVFSSVVTGMLVYAIIMLFLGELKYELKRFSTKLR